MTFGDIRDNCLKFKIERQYFYPYNHDFLSNNYASDNESHYTCNYANTKKADYEGLYFEIRFLCILKPKQIS